MKTLANCKPTEFLVQTNRIRKSVQKWLTDTDIINIRKRLPKGMPVVNDDMPEEEKAKIDLERKAMIDKQAKDNFEAILDAILDDHPSETLELLALCCFVEPENIDDYPMSFYLESVLEMLQDETVMRFFSLLMQ